MRINRLIAGILTLLFVSVSTISFAQNGKRLITAEGIPSWVKPGATVDLDFANGRTFGCALAQCLSITRASQKTNLLPSSASGFAYTTFANNTLAITPGLGVLIEESRTNQLLNSTVPATQTTASLATGTYTLWVNGSGSATMSAGTGTGCGTGTASQGSSVSFTITIAGTCTVTVSGSLNAFQIELGAFGTSLIVTTGATATRAADNIAASGGLLSIISATEGSIFFQTGSAIVVQSVWMDRDFANNVYAQAQAGTTFRQLANATSIVATLGSGNWTSGTGKAMTTWSPGAGGSVVANNGTVATNVAVFSGSVSSPKIGSYGASSQFLDGYFSRIAVWNTKLSDITAKALTQ